MKAVTLTVSKGGVGKSLLTANLGAALAEKGQKVILVEGDPNHPLQLILNVRLGSDDKRLDDVVKRNLEAKLALYPTDLANLFLMPSGMSLQRYFAIDPLRFAEKVLSLKSDFLFVDTPFPLGKAALLSLGVCEYFIPILTEDEFVLCVESAIDTIRLGKHYLKCVPVGFILNRTKSSDRFSEEFIRDLEGLLEIPCITRISEEARISKSYGGAGSEKAFLAYRKLQGTEFARSVDEIADFLINKLPAPKKDDIANFIQEIVASQK